MNQQVLTGCEEPLNRRFDLRVCHAFGGVTMAARHVLVAATLVAGLVVGAGLATAQPTRCFGEEPTIFARAGQVTRGTSGPDVIVGTSGPDVIRGRGGDDKVCSKGGDDRVFGGGGDDRMNLGSGDDLGKGGRGDDLIRGKRGRDQIFGNSGRDRLIGGSGADRLLGGSKNDVLVGNSGADVLKGGKGKDDCTGGKGRDNLSSCNEGLEPAPPPPAPRPTATPTPALRNPGDSRNCSDFSTYAAAKAWYDLYFPRYGDVARLDGNDNDGIPCESLPGAPG